MKKKNKKIMIIAVPVTIVAVAIALIVLASQGLIFSEPSDCSTTPYNDECFCFEGDNKLQIREGFVPKWICESDIKFIDPSDVDWEQQAVVYAEQRLDELYPDCDMKTCESGNSNWRVSLGSQNYEKRIMDVECEDTDGFRFSRITFDIIDGGIWNTFCANHDDIVEDTVSDNPIEINFEVSDEYRWGYVMATAIYSSDCGDKDNGIGTTTVYAPNGNISEWIIWTGGYGATRLENGQTRITQNGVIVAQTDAGVCRIIESNENFATVSCDTECPHVGFSGARVHVAGYSTEEYLADVCETVDLESGNNYLWYNWC